MSEIDKDAIIQNLAEHTMDQNNRIAALTADLDTMREDRDEHFAALVESAERLTALEANRSEWISKANKATALASKYLRDRNRYREALETIAAERCGYVATDCVAHWPDRVDDWCASCRARHALNREK